MQTIQAISKTLNLEFMIPKWVFILPLDQVRRRIVALRLRLATTAGLKGSDASPSPRYHLGLVITV